jgi:hypothetical protein
MLLDIAPEVRMVDSAEFSLGLVVLFVWWIAASIAVALAADKRGYNRGPWFLMSLFLGPIFAAVILIAYPLKIVTDEIVAPHRLSILPEH